MKAVRINNDQRVVEIFETDKEGLIGTFHPDFIASLIDGPDDIEMGMIWNGTSFETWTDTGGDIETAKAK